MTITKDRHLTVVANNLAARADLTRVTTRLAAVIGQDAIPADVLDQLDGLDADHATACDVLDLAAAEVDQARKDLTEAARRLADAEERWARAGIVVDEINRAVIAAREAAGLALTASGYQRRTP